MHLHTGCSHWVRCAPWSERRFGSTHCASQGFDAPGLRGGGRCRWRGGAGRRLHSPIRTPSHAHRLPFPPWRTLHAPSGGSSTMLAARSPPPSPSQRHPTGAFVLMQPPPRVPPPPPRMIAVSRPPSTPHRPLRQHARAPSICPSCASVRSLADFLGRSPPLYPLTCAQVRSNGTIYLKLN